METHKRLFKSDDAMIGGVCAGIAEYFDLDPTIVRIVAVVLIIVGVGAPILAYLVAWLIMPSKPKDYVSYVDVKPVGEKGEEEATASSPSASSTPSSSSASSAPPPSSASSAPSSPPASSASSSPPPPPSPSASGRFNTCGANPGTAYTSSNSECFDAVDQNAPEDVSRHKSNVRHAITFGILLMAIGVVALLGTLVDITLWRLWPLVLVVGGIIMLFTPSSKGWKIERAGNAISLIAIGLALEVWVIGIIPGRAFLLALLHLWPVFLVIFGLIILGSALQKSVFNLLGSLVFSATLLLGIWCYGQVTQPVVLEMPGDHAIVLDIPHSPEFALRQDGNNVFWVWR